MKKDSKIKKVSKVGTARKDFTNRKGVVVHADYDSNKGDNSSKYYDNKSVTQHSTSPLFLALFLLLFFAPKFIIFTLPNSAIYKFTHQNYSTRYYDRNKKILRITTVDNSIKREFCPLADIPEELQKAFLLSEDKRFYFHNGVDYVSASRAFIQNLKSKKIISGASTITMQLSRIIKKTPQNRSLMTKIKEIFYAKYIETVLSKKQILELYLNSVPFGYNTEGVTSAARTFFGLDLYDLTLSKACYLSVIPRRPLFYNPITKPQNCIAASVSIYEKLSGSKDKNITGKMKDELEEAKSFNARSNKNSTSLFYEYPFFAPHFINHVISTSKSNKLKQPTNVELTLDLPTQLFAEQKIQQALSRIDRARINNAAVLVIENSTGNVICWVGSNDWFDSAHSGQIDGVTVFNQPGSSMKPFLYALALENNYTPSTILPDIPTEFGSEDLYIPLNFNNRFNGPVRFRVALASSLNVPAVYLLSQIGVPKYLATLENLGFDSLKDGNGEKANLGLALGAGEVSLEELTRAFSVFTRDGRYIPLRYKSTDPAPPKGKQIYTADTARLIADILSDKAARVTGFGYAQTFETKYPSIFKTGTANQFQNITALGATPKYTVGVWMGNFSGNTVRGKTGSSLPATVAKQILDFLTVEDGNKYETFEKPKDYVKTRVCPISGMAVSQYCDNYILDYVKKSELESFSNKTCTWHTDSIQHLVYPEEYSKWLTLYDSNIDLNTKIMTNTDSSTSSLRIVTPTNGSIFYLNPDTADIQKIHVEIIGIVKKDNVSIYYDDKPIPPTELLLPVEIGTHTLRVQTKTEETSVNFTVR